MAKHSPLLVECLEERCVPDGNVTVFKDGLDNLIIQGDGDNNAIRIEELPYTLGLMVRGINATTINGGTTPFTAIVAGNPLGSIRISLNAGDDTVEIRNINQSQNQIFGDITINFGSGDARLVVDGIRNFTGQFRAVSGSGNFFARMTDVEFSGPVDLNATRSSRSIVQIKVALKPGTQTLGQFGDLSIRTGRGNDSVFIQGTVQGTPPQLEPLRVTNNFLLGTGSGNDIIHLETMEVLGNTSIATGTGSDSLEFIEGVFVGSVVINMDAGNDLLTIDGGFFQRGLSILTGGGFPDADTLSLTGLNINGNLKIFTGDDNDNLLLAGTNILDLPGTTQGGLSLNTGRGQDRVDVVNLNIAKDMLINLGPDNDAISFSYVNVGGKGIVDGSSGTDLLSRIALQVPRGLTLLNFNP
jgi:hypothetical protein